MKRILLNAFCLLTMNKIILICSLSDLEKHELDLTTKRPNLEDSQKLIQIIFTKSALGKTLSQKILGHQDKVRTLHVILTAFKHQVEY